MRLKIISTENNLFDGEVEEVIVPTQEWEIGILPNHAMYAWVVKWWICKFKTNEANKDFLKKDEFNVISVWDGVIYTDWKEVSIVVSSATSKNTMSDEELQKMKENLEKEIEEIKAKWSIEDIEKALFKMNKIMADLELNKYH